MTKMNPDTSVMKPAGNPYLPRLRMPHAFIEHVQESLQRFAPPLTPKHLAPRKPIPQELAQNCSLLALVADVDASNANLNVVLEDLDKLDANPVAFADTRPDLRYKFLLRSVQAELERLSEFFDQFLRLFTATSKLTQPELCKLQAIFGVRIRALMAAAEAEQLMTARAYEHAGDLDTLLRGIAYMQSCIETALPNHSTAADWAKTMQLRCRASRQCIFDTGMRVVTFWSAAIELFTSQLDASGTHGHTIPATRGSAGLHQ
jgi:hypothetical protein